LPITDPALESERGRIAKERISQIDSGVESLDGNKVLENLEEGATVDDFLSWFPGVTHEQVLAVLEFAEQSLTVT
jgi:Protein of unknown function (DUF433)